MLRTQSATLHVHYLALLLPLLSIIRLTATPLPASDPDDNWDRRFVLPGVSGALVRDASVNTLAIDGDTIYVGGTFTAAGDRIAWCIARWNMRTREWSLMGWGTNGHVNVIKIHNGQVYIGGDFRGVNGLLANSIARWDGAAWHTLDSGITRTRDQNGLLESIMINDIAFDSAYVYAVGRFSTAGGVGARNIARWNVATGRWSSLGSGVGGEIRAAEVHADGLYVGGNFSEAGGRAARNLARWDASGWSAEGDFDGTVNDLAVINGSLYAAGAFDSAGGSVAHRIAAWDGTHWRQIGGGFRGGDLQSIAGDGSLIHAVGYFRKDSGNVANSLATWDGVAWREMAPLVEARNLFTVASAKGSLFVGGAFETIGDSVCYNVAQWDGTSWRPFARGGEQGIESVTYGLVTNGDRLYVGGFTRSYGNRALWGLAEWNGTRWAHVGATEYPPDVFAAGAMVMMHGELYVAGQAGSSTRPPSVLRWDGSTWSTIAQGLNGPVAAMIEYDGSLYVAGRFDSIGGLSARNIARWDGERWHALGKGTNGSIVALASSQGDGALYVGGAFTKAGDAPASHLARWDGTAWSPVGEEQENGLNGSVGALAVAADGTLYVGGDFSRAGTNQAERLARWDGHEWSAFGGTIERVHPWSGDPLISALVVAPNGDLYVGGWFASIGGIEANSIARWDGSHWWPLGSGIEEGYALSNYFGKRERPVTALTLFGDDLYVAGRFNVVGGRPSHNIARWHLTTSSAPMEFRPGPLRLDLR